MVLRDVKYVPGFFKIVDEILVNAADNKVSLTFSVSYVRSEAHTRVYLSIR